MKHSIRRFKLTGDKWKGEFKNGEVVYGIRINENSVRLGKSPNDIDGFHWGVRWGWEVEEMPGFKEYYNKCNV